MGGFRKRHDAACALKGKRAYLRQAASSSSAPQQPAAAARKRASGVAPGVGQIVFSGNWHYSPDLKRNRVICRSDFLFEKRGKAVDSTCVCLVGHRVDLPDRKGMDRRECLSSSL